MGANADRPFLRLSNRTWSYGDIEALSRRLAASLMARGLAPGERLIAQVEKAPEAVALYLAALRCGVIYIPLNTAYTEAELAYFIEDADPALVVVNTERLASVSVGAGDRRVVALEGLPDDAVSTPTIVKRRADDVAVILYTSGTTGRSKGAIITHGNLISNARALHRIWDLRPGERILHALPIYHIHGLFVALHTAILNGSDVLFHPGFDVAAILAALPHTDVMMGVPTFYSRLLADPGFGRATCRSVRLFISGSAPLTPEVFSAFEARTGHHLLERYGMSEAGIIASNPAHGAREPGTVGYALPDCAIRIRTSEGETAPVNVTGDVEIKGPNVFKGYWRNPEKTKEAFTPDGWFRTGDVGALSADGRLSLSGRSKDLIIVGGLNVYPPEIEIALDALPEVRESAVIGAPHPDMGEGVIAVIVPVNSGAPPDELALNRALESLAKFKRPRRFFFVDNLPRNAMGKVQKATLREWYADAFSR